MNKSTLSTLAVAFSSLIGCAAPDQDSAEFESSIEGTKQDLTVEECRAQQDACFRRNPFFGAFTCPVQYAQCTAAATAEGVAAPVVSAINAARECTEEAAACVAKDPAKAASCASAQADCVAAIIGAELPPIVDGTAACVDDSVACIDGSTRPSDLVACAEDLTGCAVEEAVSAGEEVIEATVGPVFEAANKCRLSFDACVKGAEGGPAAIAECTDENAHCVTEIFGVTLPNVPVDQAADCAEQATECAFDSTRASEIAACGEDLSACLGEVIEDTTNVPKPLTCEQKWSACVAKNPFGFFTCGAELASCQD
jgi:hypothetical protein